MLNWCTQFNIFCLLDNHQYQQPYHSFECILAVDSIADTGMVSSGQALARLETFQRAHPNEWLFGHLGYDLKNEIEHLSGTHPDHIGFSDLFFFVPRVLITLTETSITIGVSDGDPEAIYQEILDFFCTDQKTHSGIAVNARFSREDYINTVRKLQQHILRGDCYEINFCQEFYQHPVQLDPLQVFLSLSETSPNPFAAFYRLQDRYLICASPERFLKKVGDTIYSQPIKGTARRAEANPALDRASMDALQQSVKERSENVMVVDLVRNDLSRFCTEGSVEVEELFAIYSFPQVHQMISTVKGKLNEDHDPVEIIRACFPMGSMTGAPKRRVMELIEQYERSRRGIFSGSVGYFSPTGDFDFNVVIRSILYNEASQYLSFQTGSAITFYSDPESEYEECLIKAAAIKKVLE